MKAGDYVRVKVNDYKQSTTIISKIVAIIQNDLVSIEDSDLLVDKNNIIKLSPNIIDLIEVGDYVNGNKVLFITKNENTRLEVVCSDGEKLLGWKSYKEKEFKSIVTKEQFESMEYKVGE